MLKKAEFPRRRPGIAGLPIYEKAGVFRRASASAVLLKKHGRFVRAFFGRGDPVAAVDKLTPAKAAALVELTVDQFIDDRGENARKVRRIRFKLANKIGALQLFGKHHKLYVDQHEHDWGAGLADRLAAALARVGKACSGETRSNIEAKAAPLEGT